MMKKAILCVDDEKPILDTLEQQLITMFGDKYLYETAESAQEALEVIEDLLVDGFSIVLLISDWLMPGMKGDEFLVNVHRKYPQVRKILLTGQAPPHAVDNAYKNADLSSYIQKPWNSQHLRDKLNLLVASSEE